MCKSILPCEDGHILSVQDLLFLIFTNEHYLMLESVTLDVYEDKYFDLNYIHILTPIRLHIALHLILKI